MLALVSACASYTPAAVENRAQLPTCGEYENRNEPVSADERMKNRCILEALDEGRPAELIRTLHGIEGDPYTEYVRVLGANRVEVFVDATRDTEAGPEARWSRWLCQDLHETRGYLERVACRETPSIPIPSVAPRSPRPSLAARNLGAVRCLLASQSQSRVIAA